MVEQAASNILEQSGTMRGSQRISTKKVGDTSFLPSMLRLVTNKILILNILGASFLMTGLMNFLAKENIFLESRFQVPRPTGKLVGFGDPILSRTITSKHILHKILDKLKIKKNFLLRCAHEKYISFQLQ